MPLIITKITNASSSIEFNYLNSEHVWGLILNANYEFSIHDARMEDGDTLLEGIEALQNAYMRPNIAAKIGIDEFRNGEITSLSLPDSSRAGITTASVAITERIKLDSDDGVLYDITQNIPSPQDVESFSEDFSFSRSENSYSYNRTVNLKYRQDTASDFFNKAYLFIKGMYFNNRPSYGFQEDGISEHARFNLGLKPAISEFYDILNKEVRFTESFSSNRIETKNGITFSKKSTHSQSLTDEGYTQKKYNIEVKALQNPIETNLNSGMQICLDDLISENTAEFGTPSSIEKTLQSDGGLASLSVSFTNDPRQNSITSIDYSASKKDGDFEDYSFSLNVVTKGPNKNDAFDQSRLYLQNNPNIAVDKIAILFPETASINLNEVSRSISFNPFKRTVSARINLTTNPDYADESDNILKRNVSISDKKQVNRDAVIPILGDKQFIIKNQNKKVGNRSVSVNMVSDKNSLVEDSILLASGHAPEADYKYLTSKTTIENPLQNSVSSKLDFTFFD
tara:strand:- start:42838 stop:44370 length:1533 start_codon:yes stop_codon:yes gene_type:complete